MKHRRVVKFCRIIIAFLFILSQMPKTPLMMSAGAAETEIPTGGHLGWPATSAVDLRKAHDAHVTPNGSYKTSVPVETPPGPGAPSLMLNYDSGVETGIAGVGWDLSVGWPSLITRDTRYGTPTWNYDSPWSWGGVSLVQHVCTQPGICSYRTAPDSVAHIEINQQTATAIATVSLPSGVLITYEAVHYDGKKYPARPSGAQTDVFAFLLKSVEDTNGYLTCFINQNWGDSETGRVAVLKEIRYGRRLVITDKKCDDSTLDLDAVHRVVLDYNELTSKGYFAPVSYRFGVPVSFNSLLTGIKIYAAEDRQALLRFGYRFEHDVSEATETRLPRLKALYQQVWANSSLSERMIRRFVYGSRKSEFSPQPILMDVWENASEFPTSLSGSVTREVRTPTSPFTDLTKYLFARGYDQKDWVAPPASALTKQWSLTDINGDGLLDTLWANESGPDEKHPWRSYEVEGNPVLPPPAQQWAFINEGVVGSTQKSSRIILDTSAPSLTNSFNPEDEGESGFTRWVWQEGRGQTRTRMPQSITSPEIPGGGMCPPLKPGHDTRLWPYFPDGSQAGFQPTKGDAIANFLSRLASFGSIAFDATYEIGGRLAKGFVPRTGVSAQLSGWTDLTGDGVPDWIVTPGMIERFTRPISCGPWAYEPKFAKGPWYIAPGNTQLPTSVAHYNAQQPTGPTGPLGLPLSFSADSSHGEFFGQTIPVGSAISSIPALAQGYTSPAFWIALADLSVQTVSPHAEAGSTLYLSVSLSSATTSLAQSGIRAAASGQVNFGASAKSFFLAAAVINLDITLVAGGNVGSGNSRAELVDFNADGYADYLLYDSVGHPVGNPPSSVPGAILLYLNDGHGSFLPPVRINDGYPTHHEQVANAVRQEADKLSLAPLDFTAARIACELDPLRILGCQELDRLADNAVARLNTITSQAKPFLEKSTDALPSQRKLYVTAAEVAREAVKVAKTYLHTPISPPGVIPPIFPIDGPAGLARTIVEAKQAADAIADSVGQLAYPSRLNMLSKNESRTAPLQRITRPGRSIGVQTSGLVDLNGDALVDYVVTRDAQKTCPVNKWDVYWGTGTSNLAANRGFASSPDCIEVPPPPADVKDVFPPSRDNVNEIPSCFPIIGCIRFIGAGGYETLPIQVDFTRLQGRAWPGETATQVSQSYVTLMDWNQDGRPDLLLAKKDGTWNPVDTSNTWTIYLNSGRGFDLKRPIPVKSLSVSTQFTAQNRISGAQNVPYPGIKSGFSERQIFGGEPRSGSSLDVGLFDVDADGTADVAQRVTFRPSGSNVNHAGILYWSRNGAAPQDLLIQEFEPLTGAQTLINYRPAPNFQWQNGTPDGKSPPGGHRAAVGTTGFLVRSVTVEPFVGRPNRRTTLGYDYKDPVFDSDERIFRGFGQVSITPLDPDTGQALANAPSLVIYYSQRSGGRGGETMERLVYWLGGPPIAEKMYGYTDKLSIQGSIRPKSSPVCTSEPSRLNASYFSARSSVVSVEYPPDLVPAILDLGFDGHWCLTNRANRADLPLDIPQKLTFDDRAATGGAVHFDGTQRIAFTAPQPELRLPRFTLETWVNPSPVASRRIIAQYPDSYELALEDSDNIAFAVKVGGAWTRLISKDTLHSDTWTHVAASYDGTTLRLFVGGVLTDSLAAGGPITFPISPSNNLRIGCGLDLITGKDIECFSGSVGELRVYPQAWRVPARITETRTEYQINTGASDFGLPLKTWSIGDTADPKDDVYHAVTYAIPQAGFRIRNAVSTQERRIFIGPISTNLGGYLDYSETSYDDLPVGQVSKGNVTQKAVYAGEAGVAIRPLPNVVTKIRYKNQFCPGVPGETEDPLGGITRTDSDSTCTFPVKITNALGHTTTQAYYGVDGVPYMSKVRGVAISGRFGQLRAATDPNGARTVNGYDIWGRPTIAVGPYDPHNETGPYDPYRDSSLAGAYKWPSIKINYQEPVIQAGKLISPALARTLTWDDVQHDYITKYAFGDGQLQVEAVNNGNPDWIISGTQDFDAFGRVIITYKPRFLSSAFTATGERCNVGLWCYFDPKELEKLYPADPYINHDPLRNPIAVAHIQTAYDNRGRVVRIYGPDVPWCSNPSALDTASGFDLACDVKARNAQPVGHFTSYEYPAPGMLRVIDARGVSAVSYYDVHNRLRRTEEYMRSSTQPYSAADYEYDRDGNVITTTDVAGNVTIETYDTLGHKLTSSDPDMGFWRYTYNKRGQLETQTDARGIITRNIYDLLGRLTRTEYFQPASSVVPKHYTFEGDLEDTQRTQPLSVSNSHSGIAYIGVTELPHPPEKPHANHALILHTYNYASPVEGSASLDVDLPSPKETKAELSFRYVWNTRCTQYPRGQCPVDDMMVEYLISGTNQRFPLVTHEVLTSVPATNRNLFDIDMANAKTLTVQFPDEALGKHVTVYFSFKSRQPNTTPGKDYFWVVDDITVNTKIPSTLADFVERHYDNAEPSPDDALLDLTFDVPGTMIDRSHYHNEVQITGTEPPKATMGSSGMGLAFDSTKQNSLMIKLPTLPVKTPALTVKAWVKPSALSPAPSNPEYLVFKDKEYALARGNDNKLICQIYVKGNWQSAESNISLPTDVWTHVALTYDGSNLRCFINGRTYGPNSIQAVPGQLSLDSGELYIGSHNGTDSFYSGLLDEIRILGVAQLPVAILNDAASPLRHGPPRGNVLDLTFDGSVTPGQDTSGANNHAVLVTDDLLLPGVQGTAFSFDGDPAHVLTIPVAPSLQSDEITTEVWVKTQEKGDRLLIGKWHGYTEPGWRLALDSNSGHVRFDVNTSVFDEETWSTWTGHTRDKPVSATSWCSSSRNGPTWTNLWVAPTTTRVRFDAIGGGVIFITDRQGKHIACKDNTPGDASVTIDVEEGKAYSVFVSGVTNLSGSFTVTAKPDQDVISTPFVTLETINDGQWHHVAGTYDGQSIGVYIDGKPAHRICTFQPPIDPGDKNDTAIDIEPGTEVPCNPIPKPKCPMLEDVDSEGRTYFITLCASGSIINPFPVFVGGYDPSFRSDVPALSGKVDEIRLSNYAKRDFEVAASARLYSAYTMDIGRSVAIINHVAYDTTSFDLLGRPVSIFRSFSAMEGTGAFLAFNSHSRSVFDNLSRIRSLRYPDGEVVLSNYDRGGTEVSLVGYGDFAGPNGSYGKQTYLKSAGRTATGRLASLGYGNGVVTSFRYDEGPTKNPATGKLNTNGTFGNELLTEQLTLLPDGDVLQDQTYVYDEVGNLLIRKDYAPPASRTPPSQHQNRLVATYTYDDLSRLKGFQTLLGGTIVASGSYDYDALGNLIAKDGLTLKYGTDAGPNYCGPNAAARPSHAVTRVIQGGSSKDYCYDANGILTEIRDGANTLATYQHNLQGKLVKMTNGSNTFLFTYDGNGTRLHKVEPSAGTVEVFPFYRVIDNFVRTEKSYFSAGRRIARRTAADPTAVFWYHTDHLGSTNYMTDANGVELVDGYSEYVPFGSALPTNANNTSGSYVGMNTPDQAVDRSGGYQFNGKELDNSGLYDYGTRYYDPAIGRFIEPDPLLFSNFPQALNRYSYVLNNPLKYIDSTGNAPVSAQQEKWIPLTNARLWEIAYEQGIIKQPVVNINNARLVGRAFQNFALSVMDLNENFRSYPSSVRQCDSDGCHFSVRPDAVGPLMSIEANVFKGELIYRNYPESAFIEVKAVQEKVGLGYANSQIIGYIDIASNSPAGEARANGAPVRPEVSFYSTADFGLDKLTLQTATDQGVTIRQRIAQENVLANPGEANLRLGESVVLNPERKWYRGQLGNYTRPSEKGILKP